MNVSRAEDRLTVRWVIDKSGKASNVHIEESSIQAPGFGSCLTATIMSWTFPVPAQTVEVSFPLVFQTSE